MERDMNRLIKNTAGALIAASIMANASAMAQSVETDPAESTLISFKIDNFVQAQQTSLTEKLTVAVSETVIARMEKIENEPAKPANELLVLAQN